MHIHILGICGTLMGSIALLARELGHDVSGCDENVYPPMSTQLEAAGISLSSPYSAENVRADADLVIIGNAGLPRGNPAVEKVLSSGMVYISGAEWLGRYVLQDRWVIAISGTHGKTTTSSMVAWILEHANMNPGFLIGGIPKNFKESARIGSAPFFVIEADEYDTSYFDRRSKFLHYRPQTLVMNNLEYDHADIFPDLAAIQNQFHLLLRTVPETGLIIHPLEDQNISAVIKLGCWTPRLTFSCKGVDHNQANLSAHLLSEDGSEFEVLLQGDTIGTVKWSLTGNHNVHNSLAAIAAARHAGVKPVYALEALCNFQGVKRRMELIFDANKVLVYDDFAHHPSAIQSTLEGLRKQVGDDRILAIIEPRSHTMRKGIHKDTLAPSITAADEAIWLEPANLDWDFAAAVSSPRSRLSQNIDEIIQWAIQFTHQGDRTHIVIMSNGGFDGIHGKLITALEDSV